jgi:hypothetical protein
VIKLHVNLMFIIKEVTVVVLIMLFIYSKVPPESLSFLTVITVSYLVNNLKNIDISMS